MCKTLLFVIPLLLLGACTNTNSNENLVDFEGVSFNNAVYTYDGNPHIIGEVQGAPEGTTITYSGRDYYTDAGTYPAQATLSKKGYNRAVLDAYLLINEATFSGIQFANKTVDYDGQPHSITATGVPSFASVTYENNTATAVGTYNATVTITAKNYKTKVLHATLTIQEPLQEFEGIIFENKTFYYDGNYHTIYPENVPSDAGVYYIGTYQYRDINTNGYTIICEIRKNGYRNLRLTAKLYILANEFSSVSFPDRIIWYDAYEHTVKVDGVPESATVTYKCLNNTSLTNRFKDIGEYKCQATITQNYYTTKVLTATITIKEPNFGGVDETITPYQFDSTVKYQDLYKQICKENVTITSIFESVRTIESTGEEYARYFFSTTTYYVNPNAYCDYMVSYDTKNPDIVDFTTFSVGSISGDYGFYMHSFSETELSKMPAIAFRETVLGIAYEVFRFYNEGENGSFVGHNINGYVSNIPELIIEENKITLIIHNYYWHSDDSGVDEPIINDERNTYVFTNIGNTTVNIPDSLKGDGSKPENYENMGFMLNGIKYAIEDDYAKANVEPTYRGIAMNNFVTTFTILPIVMDLPVKYFISPSRRIYWERDSYEGLTLNLYVGEGTTYDGYPYQGEYADLGVVFNSPRSDGLDDFIYYGGSVNYYGQW